MKTYQKTTLHVLLLTLTLILAHTDAAAAVTRRFDTAPLQDVLAAAQADPKCPGLTKGELAVMMLAPTLVGGGGWQRHNSPFADGAGAS
jgi:hypothetical protein